MRQQSESGLGDEGPSWRTCTQAVQILLPSPQLLQGLPPWSQRTMAPESQPATEGGRSVLAHCGVTLKGDIHSQAPYPVVSGFVRSALTSSSAHSYVLPFLFTGIHPVSTSHTPNSIPTSASRKQPALAYSDKLEIGQYSTTTAFNHFSFETQTIQGKFYTDSNILQCI